MQAVIKDYSYIPGHTRFIQGIKNNRRPRGAVAGGNGSFYVHEPAKILLKMKGNTGRPFEINIYEDLHDYYGSDGKRVTEKRATTICERLLGQTVEIDKNTRSIRNIGEFLD